MTYDDGPYDPGSDDGVPEGIDRRGVPAPYAGRDAFLLLLAVTAALLALIFTLGWVVYHHLTVSAGLAPILG